ncbi:MAG: hypothetical protein ACREOK_00785, partial [Gemmatimonadaceae bacterium]
MGAQERLELLAAEVWMAARAGKTSNVSQGANVVRLEQCEEFVGRAGGVADGPDGDARFAQNSRFFISLKNCERSMSASSSCA